MKKILFVLLLLTVNVMSADYIKEGESYFSNGEKLFTYMGRSDYNKVALSVPAIPPYIPPRAIEIVIGEEKEFFVGNFNANEIIGRLIRVRPVRAYSDSLRIEVEVIGSSFMFDNFSGDDIYSAGWVYKIVGTHSGFFEGSYDCLLFNNSLVMGEPGDVIAKQKTRLHEVDLQCAAVAGNKVYLVVHVHYEDDFRAAHAGKLVEVVLSKGEEVVIGTPYTAENNRKIKVRVIDIKDGGLVLFKISY